MSHRLKDGLPVWIALLAISALAPRAAFAQLAGSGAGTGTGAGTAQVGQGTGAVGGIRVDAEGVVRPMFVRDRTGTLDKKRRSELAARNPSGDVNAASDLRKVSLVRLEAACEPFAAEGRHATDEMQYLAGLQRIDYVFVDPESKDIVIAGPAEGFVIDGAGRAIGVSTGRPPLRLDDLMIALRAVAREAGDIGCSIDPQAANLAKLQGFLNQSAGALSPEGAKAKFARLAPILGMQDVRVFGVPAETHFAEVLVEADVRMKRLAIGVDQPPVKGFRSHLAFVGSGENTMQRWWFAPLYDAFVRSNDDLAFAFAGQRVQMLSQEELVSGAGQRTSAPFTHVSALKFAKQFTDRYDEIAAASPVFAELQNLFDLAILAALLRKERLPERIGWRLPLYLDLQRGAVAARNVPRHVESLCNYKVLSGGMYVAQIGGGVTIDPRQVLGQAEYQRSDGLLEATRSESFAAERPPSHVWWWD